MATGRRTPKEYDGKIPLPDNKQELFCVIFTTNTLPKFWNNAMHSYSFAYGFLDKMNGVKSEIDKLEALKAQPKQKRKNRSFADIQREIDVKNIEIKNMLRTCRAAGARLLTGVSIKLRCNHFMDQLATHTIVDRELVYLIQQRDDLNVKARAIEHHDKREQRIRDRIDIKHEFEPIEGFTYVKPVKKEEGSTK